MAALPRKIRIAVILQVALAGALVALGAFVASSWVRDRLLADALTEEAAHYWDQRSLDPAHRAPQSRLVRGMRMFDSLAPIGSRRAPSREMRASYLVRFPLNVRMWKLHVARIRGDARRLRAGETLHLWWHPHNLGADVKGSLNRLAELVDVLRNAAPADTRFLSMRDSGRDGAVAA